MRRSFVMKLTVVVLTLWVIGKSTLEMSCYAKGNLTGCLVLEYELECSGGDNENKSLSQTPIVIDRMSSTFTENTLTYAVDLQKKMNCYGYAIQVHCTYGTSTNAYKQQPGEFAIDSQTFADLVYEYYLLRNGTDGAAFLNAVKAHLISDFASLNSSYGSEWVVEESSASEVMTSGYRKIAIVVGCAVGGARDFHFYMRHKDGTWSHKSGSSALSCISKTSNVQITDSNISTVATEGGYSDGICFLKIKKSAVIDYPHYHGQNANQMYTVTCFKERAGSKLQTSKSITGNSTLAGFDYEHDNDCFVFSPSSTGIYTLTTSLSGSTYNVDMILYDTYGNILQSDLSSSNASITANLTLGQRYFIRVFDDNHNLVNYTLYHHQ